MWLLSDHIDYMPSISVDLPLKQAYDAWETLIGGLDMSKYRLKMTIHGHTFDAEGDPEVVQAQFEVFKELVLQAPAHQGPEDSVHSSGETSPEDGGNKPLREREQPGEALERVMEVEGRVVSLTVPAESVDDAALLLVYGQKELRGQESVTGGDIMRGLEISGYGINRVDRIMQKASDKGSILMIGKHRSKKIQAD